MKFRTVQITRVENGYLVTVENDDGSFVTYVAVDFNQAVALINTKKFDLVGKSGTPQ